ncbi:hypothetical protein [Bordetella tumulicola]|uniref:hypothetical protein n=1 Tax=Bordetella tumulicola TaxID=1649133 RepID=UPI0039F044B3
MGTSHGRRERNSDHSNDSSNDKALRARAEGNRVQPEAYISPLGESLDSGNSQVERLQRQLQEMACQQQDFTAKLDERNREIADLIVMLEARDAAVGRLLKQEEFAENLASTTEHEDAVYAERPADKSSALSHSEAEHDTLGIYEQTIIELSKETESLNAEIAFVRNELLAARKQIVQIERERNKAKQELQAHFTETANLTSQLEDASQEIQLLRQEWSSAKSEVTAASVTGTTVKPSTKKLFRSLKSWVNGNDGGRKVKKALTAEIEIVQGSEYFNATWYLETYPDVAKSGMEPAMHYVKFGAMEGRDPGPRFSTMGYIREYPAVLDQKMNPLVHYMTFGKVK